MKKKMSRSARRFWLIVNYASFAVMAFIWEIPFGSAIPFLTVLGSFVVSAYFIYKTGAQRLFKRKVGLLDERELQIVQRAHRRANVVLRILTTTALVGSWVALANKTFICEHMIILTGAIFVLWFGTQTLPVAMLAWSEREIYRD